MSTSAAVLAWIGLAIGLVAAVVALVLLQRVLRPITEIKRYADDTLDAGLGIAQNVDAIDQAVRTRELAVAVPGLATRYLELLGAKRP